MLDKTYRPDEVEQRLYQEWEASGAFRCGQANGQPYVLMLPPPNVTGTLHMGHALNHTLQDILARYHRMQGRDVLWQPGTDHAGIATQMVVERELEKEGKSRQNLGREEFLKRVWDWKATSGGAITQQQRRLGETCDWSRERFTMDEGLSHAVRRVFVTLYKQGLIYKDQRLVNWDPKFQTAISDLEVEPREIKGHLWHIRYAIEGEEDRFITIATTRPETLLADAAIAVHPDDERYKDLVGKNAILPLVGRAIPILADSYSDPEKGTGAVKITPAHDFNDFEVGRRHGLPLINILDRFGAMNDQAPQAYRGLDRFKAREIILADLESQGYLVKAEPNIHMVPHGDRSGVVIEPWLTDQWYCDAATLAKPAIAAVERGDIQFTPKNWEKTYFEWMRNIQPWCISRQLWWGHQIPAWYGPDGHVFVEETEDEAIAAARAHYGHAVELSRDADVLDTWFSSALWPFSTLGWPDATPELEKYYPTDLLVTGFDIIFFWVARMVMFGLHFMEKPPFRTVYIHALVRDEKGQKMSKSKGNVIDPLALIDQYGADALRFTLTALAAQGRDVKLSAGRVEGYRNFGTKLWNAARFAEMNGCLALKGYDPNVAELRINRWIITELGRTVEKVTQSLESCRFNDAAMAVYHFTWNDFCDWYLELIKPILNGAEGPAKSETRAVCAWVLGKILHLLHPFMPFISEELWRRLFKDVYGAGDLIIQPWPETREMVLDEEAEEELSWLIGLISEIRAVRAEMNVPAATKIDVLTRDIGAKAKTRLSVHDEAIKRLARIETIKVEQDPPQGAAQIIYGDAVYFLPLAGIIDFAKEKARLEKEAAKLESDIQKIDGLLSNAGFMAKAPEEVVEENRVRRTENEAALSRLKAALSRLA